MLQIGSATGNVLMVAQGVTDKLRWYFIHGPRRSRNDSNCIASLQSTNVHDDGLSPSVMKALATESRRHRGKAFFSLLCASVATSPLREAGIFRPIIATARRHGCRSWQEQLPHRAVYFQTAFWSLKLCTMLKISHYCWHEK